MWNWNANVGASLDTSADGDMSGLLRPPGVVWVIVPGYFCTGDNIASRRQLNIALINMQPQLTSRTMMNTRRLVNVERFEARIAYHSATVDTKLKKVRKFRHAMLLCQ